MQNKNNNKFFEIMKIPCLDEMSIKKAKILFIDYRKKGIIKTGLFEDTRWYLTDEYANTSFNFSLDGYGYNFFCNRANFLQKDFIEYFKSFIIYQLGDLSLISIQHMVNDIKAIIGATPEDMKGVINARSPEFISRIEEFFSILPLEKENEEINIIFDSIDDYIDKRILKSGFGQRTLASFDSYFTFGELLSTFWRECEDINTKLFFFPVFLWWNLTGIIPLRPREFVLTPRKCLEKRKGVYVMKIRRNRIKGSNKTVSYNINDDYRIESIPISNTLAKEIEWYLKGTEDMIENELSTLFVTNPHYRKWERSLPINSRYFTYINLRTCLRYFFFEIISAYYGYEIVFDRETKTLKPNQIQYISLGDTRHLSLINLMAEGATPMITMMLAGHDNPNMSSHYYSNITNFIECQTARQYRKLGMNQSPYSISNTIEPLHARECTIISDNGDRCYSVNFTKGDYSDCEKVAGPVGEIGYCENCIYYRTGSEMFDGVDEKFKVRILNECRHLDQVVNEVRHNKGETEDITQALMRLRHEEHSYKEYLNEKRRRKNG